MTEEPDIIDVGPTNPQGLPWFATFDGWLAIGRVVKKGEKAWSFEYNEDFRKRKPLFRASQTRPVDEPFYDESLAQDYYDARDLTS